MNKILSTTLCFGLLTLLSVTIFLELVHGLPYFIQGNELFPNKEDTNREELLLALLNKIFDFQRPSNIAGKDKRAAHGGKGCWAVLCYRRSISFAS
uniref:Urotensin-2B n=1 Tax=Sus scrofa TaxID=9823 RepID=A0A480DMQ8_PIG